MWTFETETPTSWVMQRSEQRFGTMDEAITAMTEWVKASAVNDFFPDVRLVKVED